MVDRPIKKSDRKAAQQANPADDQSKGDKPTAARNTPKPIKKADRTDGGSKSSNSQGDRDERGRGGKGKGRGRGRGKDDAPKAPMNPALMRGPKPTKKVEVEEVATEEDVAEEVVSEEVAEEAGQETVAATESEGTPAEAATEATVEETAPVAASDTETKT